MSIRRQPSMIEWELQEGESSRMNSKPKTGRSRHSAATIAMGALILVACAQQPETINPTYVSADLYWASSCERLAQEVSRLDRAVAVMSTEQRSKRTNDVVGWIYLLRPTASIGTRDIRPQIALQLGERAAIEQVMAQRCWDPGRRPNG